MTVTLLAARRALLKTLPELGSTYTPTAFAAGSVTIGSLANTNFPTSKFRNRIIYREESATAAGADNLRYAGLLTVATGLLAHTGANYTDTTVGAELVELWDDPELRPDIHINAYYAEALDQLRVLCRIPLAHGPLDYDMQSTGITNWTANAGTPFAKQVTDTEVYWGRRSGVLTDAGSGGDYTQSGLYPVGQGRAVNMFGIVKADTGTSKLSLLDGAGNTQYSISTTQEDWMLLSAKVTMDSADEQVRLRLQSVEAAASGDWQAAWFVKEDEEYFPISRNPGWITSSHHVVGISVGEPRVNASEADTALYGSMEYSPLQEGVHYWTDRPAADANPTGIHVPDVQLRNLPLFIDVSCPWSSPYGNALTFTLPTDSTACPTELLNAQVKLLIAERWQKKYGYLAERGKTEKLAMIGQEMYRTRMPNMSGWAKGAFR